MTKNIFIPIKEHSERVPRKNFREFCGKPLYLHTLYKYDGLDVKIFINTDSEEIENEIKKEQKKGRLFNVNVIRRKNKLIGDDVSVNLLIQDFLDEKYVEWNDWIAQIHVTTPFLNAETVIKSLEYMLIKGLIRHEDKFKNKIGEYDSATSVTIHRARLWRNESYGFCPVNHNPMKLEKTQDLPVLYEENSCFYIFNRNNFNKIGGYRVGKMPYFSTIYFPENLDIDTEEDMDMCLKLSKII